MLTGLFFYGLLTAAATGAVGGVTYVASKLHGKRNKPIHLFKAPIDVAAEGLKQKFSGSHRDGVQVQMTVERLPDVPLSLDPWVQVQVSVTHADIPRFLNLGLQAGRHQQWQRTLLDRLEPAGRDLVHRAIDKLNLQVLQGTVFCCVTLKSATDTGWLAEKIDVAIGVAAQLATLRAQAATWLAVTAAQDRTPDDAALGCLKLLASHYRDSAEHQRALRAALHTRDSSLKLLAALQLGDAALRKVAQQLDWDSIRSEVIHQCMPPLLAALDDEQRTAVVAKALRSANPAVKRLTAKLLREGQPDLLSINVLAWIVEHSDCGESVCMAVRQLALHDEPGLNSPLLVALRRIPVLEHRWREGTMFSALRGLSRHGTAADFSTIKRLVGQVQFGEPVDSQLHLTLEALRSKAETSTLALTEGEEPGALALSTDGGDLALR